MNTIYNSIKYGIASGVLCLGLISVNSCSSRENDTPKEDINGTVLNVNIAGITDNTAVQASAVASNKIVSGSSEGQFIAENRILNLNGFDAQVSFEKSGPNGLNNSAVASSAKIMGMATASPMTSGIKYRLMIYNSADINHTSPVANVDATSGTDPAIKIDAGKTYNWYAFSTNETTLPATTNGVVAKSDLKNKDVLIANGSLSAQYGNNYLNIVFNHNTARVNISVDSRGMFGTMNANPVKNLNVNLLKYGDLNVFTGLYSNTTAYASNDVTPISNGNNTLKTYTYYTVDNTTAVSAKGLSLQVNATGIVKKDTYGGSDTTVTIPDNTNIPFNNNAFTLAYNNAYNLNVRLIESGVKVGGITWARSNISWKEDPVLGTRIFDPNPRRAYFVGSSAGETGYYHWGANYDSNVCEAIYPAGVWRLPTIKELKDTFIGRNYSRVPFYYSTPASTLSTANGVAGYEYDLDPGSVINTAYPELAQKLFFPIAGEYLNGNYIKHAFFIKQTDGPINDLELNIWADDHTKVLRWTSRYNGDGTMTLNSVDEVTTVYPFRSTIRCVRA
nr:hypothetical protein [Elizabethkingia sp. ASV34]